MVQTKIMVQTTRQQNSFGQNLAKQCRAVRQQGIGNICRRVGHEQVRRPQAYKAGQLFPAQVLSDLQRKGPCGKEAFLLT